MEVVQRVCTCEEAFIIGSIHMCGETRVGMFDSAMALHVWGVDDALGT